jgi:YD repeat-containing protein
MPIRTERGYTAPDGSTNTYTYDTLNRMTGLANSWAGSFGFTYDALNRRTQMTQPNGVATNYSYDKLSHLRSVLHQLSGNIILCRIHGRFYGEPNIEGGSVGGSHVELRLN